ncbi:hypothetical protein LFL97_23095 [Burkholderia sp. JSH-S8]|uniref:hypothetical protein n=1 Tax=Burkholderia stagnalis TaxID=1503054 RepID=UPI000F7FDD2F|nr:hypothetical protein [Burkholderia stagnalis]WGS45617.1 hypothetical protein LFL97_23095 [Burkholderia sp. JSH-S8]
MHDAIEAVRNWRLKRTSISKNNRQLLPAGGQFISAPFPGMAGYLQDSRHAQPASDPYRAGVARDHDELFFNFLLARSGAGKNFTARISTEYCASRPGFIVDLLHATTTGTDINHGVPS